MSKYKFEEKLDIVSQVKNGKPIYRLAKEKHIREHTILEWVRKYDLYGECGLRRKPPIRATLKLKEEVVRLSNRKICTFVFGCFAIWSKSSYFSTLGKISKNQWLLSPLPIEETGTTIKIYGTTKKTRTRNGIRKTSN